MSRRSAANEVFLWTREHGADRNVPGLEAGTCPEHVARVLARLGTAEAAPHIAKLADAVMTGRMTAFMALGERSVGDPPLREVLFTRRGERNEQRTGT